MIVPVKPSQPAKRPASDMPIKMGIVLLFAVFLQTMFNTSELTKTAVSISNYDEIVLQYLPILAANSTSSSLSAVPPASVFPSLNELVSSNKLSSSVCDQHLFYMEDVVVPNAYLRKIPKVVHITGKTRCLAKVFYDNINKWKFVDHSFYFHDEAAVDRLLQQHWPEFPQLQHMQHCLISGAAKADLWRYLVLWRYGGIYTDMDNAPNNDFFLRDENGNPTNHTIINGDDDSFFVVERIGVLSQYFMAASPKHPLLYLCVMQVFHRLMNVEAVGTQYVPFVTGPGALKNAFIQFMSGGSGGGRVQAGHYTGHNNRTVTVVGTKMNSDRYVQRESIAGHAKRRGYREMGMSHFSSAGQPTLNISCFLKLFDETTSQQVVGR